MFNLLEQCKNTCGLDTKAKYLWIRSLKLELITHQALSAQYQLRRSKWGFASIHFFILQLSFSCSIERIVLICCTTYCHVVSETLFYQLNNSRQKEQCTSLRTSKSESDMNQWNYGCYFHMSFGNPKIWHDFLLLRCFIVWMPNYGTEPLCARCKTGT